ncbi:Ribosomal protein [Trema orientale]|uniref:Ribosomal protein n=1 Tax=Trema orientale TaxID=63057 RepID=A0A2P5FWK7_TREOI|nr:Ribosomal protein [Trema orientale]
MLLRRGITFALKVKPNFLSTSWSFCSKASSSVLDEGSESVATNYSSNLHLSPLFPDAKPHVNGYGIELVDDSTWQLSSGLAQAWRKSEAAKTRTSSLPEEGADDLGGCYSLLDGGDPDFDDIDNMRIRGSLFYKIDRDSKEFEEYSFDFHRKRKSSKKKDEPMKSERKQNDSKEGQREKLSSSKKKGDLDENERKQNGSDEALRNNPSRNLASVSEKPPKVVKNKCGLMSSLDQMDVGKKKLRTPTFNQLTAPYHEPFCLDIFISKASVRACIVHRVTSKVVAVAHSISKDMKFDLASTRNSAACSAVGSVLAQRALADDIHDIVYTPRKGERLEGKLQLVLQSIIDNGINVKVKIKQRKFKKTGPPIHRLQT